jgi:CheY-like chemotaxis protein
MSSPDPDLFSFGLDTDGEEQDAENALLVERCNQCGTHYVGHQGDVCQCGGRIDRIPAELLKQALLVEDSLIDQLKFRRLLRKVGFRVRCEENGKEALLWLKEHVPDLIVLDVMMPVLGGIETLEAIRGDLRLLEVPVVMLTNKDDTRIIRAVLRRGPTDYLLKASDPGTLEQRLRRFV